MTAFRQARGHQTQTHIPEEDMERGWKECVRRRWGLWRSNLAFPACGKNRLNKQKVGRNDLEEVITCWKQSDAREMPQWRISAVAPGSSFTQLSACCAANLIRRRVTCNNQSVAVVSYLHFINCAWKCINRVLVGENDLSVLILEYFCHYMEQILRTRAALAT